MTIIPIGKRIKVTQSNREFKKVYSNEFDNTKEGMREAIGWAASIDLGWHSLQDEDWERRHCAA